MSAEDCTGSRFHATVARSQINGTWVFAVFEDWGQPHQRKIVSGGYRDWLTSFCQAAGTVSTFRSAYEYKGPRS
jgi:hypothetical protein